MDAFQNDLMNIQTLCENVRVLEMPIKGSRLIIEKLAESQVSSCFIVAPAPEIHDKVALLNVMYKMVKGDFDVTKLHTKYLVYMRTWKCVGDKYPLEEW